jgi:hypothetical protein
MTSVLLRILKCASVAPGNEYVPNLPADGAQGGVPDTATSIADRPPELGTVGVRPVASAPPGTTDLPTETRTESAAHPDSAVSGRGNRSVNALLRAGGRVRPGTAAGVDPTEVPLEEAG